MTTPTTKPVPSNSPLDLLFNAEKLDEVVNSTGPSYLDRFGQTRLSVQGAVDSLKAITTRGAWVGPGTAYATRDVVSVSGTWYIAVTAHTSSAAFVTDAAKWRVYQGVISGELAAATGSEMVGHIAVAGAPTRSIGSKLRDLPSVKDFGAVGSGTVFDTTAFESARANGVPYIVPAGSYKLAGTFDSGDVPLIGLGAALDPDNNGASVRSFIDLGRKAIFRKAVRNSGEYVGTPTGYTYPRDIAGIDISHINAAGYQQSFATDAGGRTGIPAIFIETIHSGYGDVPGVSVHASVSRHASYASITSFAGANSCVLYDGEVGAVTDNVNLYGAEFHLSDNGKARVAANGLVLSLARNNGSASNSGTYNTVWTGLRLQTHGTYAGDSAVSVNGKWNVGIDFTGSTLTNNAAMAMKTGDRIYWGAAASAPPNWWASTLPTNYQEFSGGAHIFSVAGTPALTIGATEIRSVAIHRFVNSWSVSSGGNISTTVGASGTAAALPAQPALWLRVGIDGSFYKTPLYNI